MVLHRAAAAGSLDDFLHPQSESSQAAALGVQPGHHTGYHNCMYMWREREDVTKW